MTISTQTPTAVHRIPIISVPVAGISVYRQEGRIVRIEDGCRKIAVNQRVEARQRKDAFSMFQPGRRGTVVVLHEPHDAGRSSDFIGVLWDGDSCLQAAKFEDLVFNRHMMNTNRW